MNKSTREENSTQLLQTNDRRYKVAIFFWRDSTVILTSRTKIILSILHKSLTKVVLVKKPFHREPTN